MLGKIPQGGSHERKDSQGTLYQGIGRHLQRRKADQQSLPKIVKAALTLNEEKETDQKLTTLTERINVKAAAAGVSN
jgi:hypothetical protein